jgi:E3 ubiquitin-protein ligase UBR4
MVIAGSKDGYRFLRDKYTIAEHMVSISKLCALSVGQDERVTNLDQPLSLDYEQLSAVVEKLRSINEVAVHRAPIWQRLCAQDVDEDADSATLPFLMRLACVVPEVMSEVVLELIVGALCPSTKPSRRQKKSEDGAAVAETDPSRPPADLTLSRKLAASLVARSVDCGLLTRFLSRYLLQSNVVERRWQAHILVRHLFDLCPAEQQTAVLDVLWKQLWPKASKHGIKASQLVDLLTVFLTKLRSVDELTTISKSLVDMFRQDVRRIETHANANLYCSLSTFLDTEMGYYLEPSPCLVCNHPEVPMTNMKLSAVKLDSRSTTTAQIFKLTGSHELSRVTLKLSELKRNKMVKRLNLYYCNKPVGSAVELKNRPELWSKAHTVVMTAAQTEVKIEVVVRFFFTEQMFIAACLVPRAHSRLQSDDRVCRVLRGAEAGQRARALSSLLGVRARPSRRVRQLRRERLPVRQMSLHQLRRERSVPLQFLRLFQVRQVRLLLLRPTDRQR